MLIKQILKTAAGAIISLLLIAGIAFYLFEQSPIPLDEGYYLSDEASQFDRNAVQERKSLINIGQALNLDQAVFYFKLSSPLYPRDMHLILPLRERRAVRSLCKVSKQPAHILKIRSYLLQLLDEQLEEDVNIEVVRLLSIPSLDEFKSRYRSLQRILPESRRNLTLIDKLQSKEEAHFFAFLPRMEWHGLNNRWHKRMTDFFRLDWGRSWIDGRPVSRKIGEAIPWTLLLNGIAFVILFGASIPIGRFWALHPDSRWTILSKQIAYFFTVAPIFWIATLSIILLTGGFGLGLFHLPTPADYSGFALWPLLLPLLVIFISGIGYLSRQYEDQLINELKKDYIKMSLARGLPKSKVIKQYASRNALLPLITLAGASLPALISGSLVIEVLFNIPGMGRLIWFSLFSRDWPMIFVVLLLIGVFAWLGRWGADRLSQWIDPRTKLDAI